VSSSVALSRWVEHLPGRHRQQDHAGVDGRNLLDIPDFPPIEGFPDTAVVEQGEVLFGEPVRLAVLPYGVSEPYGEPFRPERLNQVFDDDLDADRPATAEEEADYLADQKADYEAEVAEHNATLKARRERLTTTLTADEAQELIDALDTSTKEAAVPAESIALARWLEHATHNQKDHGRRGMSFDDLTSLYGEVHDEASTEDYSVVVFENGDFGIFADHPGDRPQDHRREPIYDGLTAQGAEQLADLIDTAASYEIPDDAKNDPDVHLVDWDGDDEGNVVGYDVSGDVSLRFPKRDDPDIDNPDDWHILDVGVDEAVALAQALRDMAERRDELDETTESISPALVRWLEHGTHNQKSHGNRYRIPGDKRSGILPSVKDLKALAEKKGVKVPARARKAEIAKMLDPDGGVHRPARDELPDFKTPKAPKQPAERDPVAEYNAKVRDERAMRDGDDLFPGRPRQSEKLDAKLDDAFGPAPSRPAGVEAAKDDIRAAVQHLTGGKHGEWASIADVRDRLGERHTRADVDAALRQLGRHGSGYRVIPIANRKSLEQRDHDAAVLFNPAVELSAAHVIAVHNPGQSDSTTDAVRQAAELSDGTGRPSRFDYGTASADARSTASGRPKSITSLPDDKLRSEYDRAQVGKFRREELRGELQDRGLIPHANRADTSGRPGGRVGAAKAGIRTAVAKLQREPGAWVGLARLRDELGERHNRHDVDRALLELSLEPDVNVVPESNQKALRQADLDAEVVIGDQRKHAIRIEPQATVESPRGRPSGLPAKPMSGDFDDLADRVSRMRTAAQIHEVLTDLNATELNRLARKFAGSPIFLSAGLNTRGGAYKGLKPPPELPLAGRRLWLAKQLIDARSHRAAWR
jgi:hypothetical protein